jgi:hypothetical protein
MNRRRRTLTIAIAIFGLAGGLTASAVPAAHAADDTICFWKVTTDGTDFFKDPGQNIIGHLNNGDSIENPVTQTAQNGSSTYEHGSNGSLTGWVREARIVFQFCKSAPPGP